MTLIKYKTVWKYKVLNKDIIDISRFAKERDQEYFSSIEFITPVHAWIHALGTRGRHPWDQRQTQTTGSRGRHPARARGKHPLADTPWVDTPWADTLPP